ncbi:hypothetical protein CEXT_689821 [Caerostris extrusa]|uniref:Uncharacterized protein n=1 Tax=Caerostris extrusa TaxID=172846 RepID=A0AAV4WY59_CAEEX|nr:hypothetical protein CEXT_689821 [Caerostris extrusa]
MTVDPEPRLPPIMVRFNDGLKEHVAAISNRIRVKLAGEQLKIFPVNSDVHRAVTRYLTEKKLEFFVITPKKSMLKGLPVSYSTAEIEEGLSELGLNFVEKSPENVNIFQKTYYFPLGLIA